MVHCRAQNAVKGIILSSTDSTPVAGATVQIPSTVFRTTTNERGRFTLVYRGLKRFKLSVSSIGFEPVNLPVEALRDTLLFISLQPALNQLEKVVVSTGYQQLPKERATGSFSVVDQKVFNQQVGTDVLSRLEATVNGLTVDRTTSAEPKITIRGLSTIRGPRDPLIVLDNFPYDGDINNINPNDIESVNVLKDAAASSIWGARAGNGVIVINTRKARFNQPISIEFNSNLTIGNKPDLSYVRQMSSSDFIDVEQLLYSKGYYTNWINSTGKRLLSNVVELLTQRDNGLITPAAAESQINLLRTKDIRDDFNRFIYQKSLNQQYALNIKGGEAKMNWSVAGGYDHNTSNLKATYERFSLRTNQNYLPFKNFQLTTGAVFTQSLSSSGRPGYGNITQYGNGFLPYTSLADENGNVVAVPKNVRPSYLQAAGGGKLLDWLYYPLEDYKHNTSRNSIQDVVLNAGLNYKLPLGISADVKYQYERQQSTERGLQDENSYYARNLVNSFTQINSAGTVNYIIPRGGILDLSTSLLQAHNLRGQLNYNRSWKKNEINALIGTEIRRVGRSGNDSRLYGYDDNILSFGNVDYRNPYPNFISGNTSYIENRSGINETQTNFVSSYVNAAYSYDQKYIISGSARRDASNLFGLKTNDQWNPFASIGLAWVISNEKFYHGSSIPYLKIRGTYGFSGNINPAMSAVTTVEYHTTSPFTNSPIARFINYYNPELRWETSKMLNLGIDFKAFGNRLNGSFEYYTKNGTNLFGTAVIDYTTGIGRTVIKNVASMKGKGFDLELRGVILQRKFNWQSALNLSYYKDQVTDYYLSSQQGSNFVGNIAISGIVGKPVYSLLAYQWAGLDPANGDPRGYVNGEISKDYVALTGSGTTQNDLAYFGSAIPTVFGSFLHSFSFKKVTLNVNAVYKLGYYFRRSTIDYDGLFSSWTGGHSDFSLRWQKPGDEAHTDIPSLVFPSSIPRSSFYQNASPFVEKADHIRIQYVNLSYELDGQIIRRLPVKRLQLYFNINNLGIIWRANKLGLDPDYASSLSYLVPPKSYSFGLRATFN
ncbi:SusC/RagA family TonB-linked outer membrane protein [Mucilaginibacter terrae]|uniref:SusC/RagA family TonB-linked outer membrane protein n=1 Tax=Mucilaginibacter terrae TaxID=1955052 RepID=UPI0028A1B61C|nr:SusC/RagA family TonB-linked outer membrane protein [Mucilaginibacter terrae]